MLEAWQIDALRRRERERQEAEEQNRVSVEVPLPPPGWEEQVVSEVVRKMPTPSVIEIEIW
jgi:hypothetical protein